VSLLALFSFSPFLLLSCSHTEQTIMARQLEPNHWGPSGRETGPLLAQRLPRTRGASLMIGILFPASVEGNNWAPMRGGNWEMGARRVDIIVDALLVLISVVISVVVLCIYMVVLLVVYSCGWPPAGGSIHLGDTHCWPPSWWWLPVGGTWRLLLGTLWCGFPGGLACKRNRRTIYYNGCNCSLSRRLECCQGWGQRELGVGYLFICISG